MRTHLTNSTLPIILRDKSQHEKGVGIYKPAGFWYEVDGDWRRWCEAENFGFYTHLYKVSLNDCNVLLIDTLAKLDAFHSQYCTSSALSQPDWLKVATLWDGIEIAPYQWKRRLSPNFMWYYGWDCASGVIWRPKNAAVDYIGKYEPASESVES